MTRFGLWGLGERLWGGVGGEVFPGWVRGFDQCNFFLTSEVLQVFLANDGSVDVLEAFEVDQAVDFVLCSETVRGAIAMFIDAAQETVGDANVEGARAAGQDVDVILMITGHR
jgi:hypothetical protein